MWASPVLTDRSRNGWPVSIGGTVCSFLMFSAISCGSKAGGPVVRGNRARILSRSGGPENILRTRVLKRGGPVVRGLFLGRARQAAPPHRDGRSRRAMPHEITPVGQIWFHNSLVFCCNRAPQQWATRYVCRAALPAGCSRAGSR